MTRIEKLARDYYNTNRESGETLTLSRAKAGKQQDLILTFFTERQRKRFAPHEVYEAFGGRWPITSVRRSITNLTNDGLLAKTPIMRPGAFGKAVHTWQLAGGA